MKSDNPTVERTPLEQSKLMMDAKVVVDHYDWIISKIDPATSARDGDETDFVMTVKDYETLRDFALQEYADHAGVEGELEECERMSQRANDHLIRAERDVTRLNWLARHPRKGSIRIGSGYQECNFWGGNLHGRRVLPHREVARHATRSRSR